MPSVHPTSASPSPIPLEWLTIPEVCTQLGMNSFMVHELVANGPINACDFDGTVMVRASDLEQFRRSDLMQCLAPAALEGRQ